MTIRVLFILGVILFTADATDFNFSGVALLALILWVLAGWMGGVFTRDFWIADIPESHPDAFGSLDNHERTGR